MFEDLEDNDDSDGELWCSWWSIEMCYAQPLYRYGSSWLIVDPRCRGSIIDKIEVFGLLANYETGLAVVVKL